MADWIYQLVSCHFLKKNQRIRYPQSWFLGLRTSYLCALVLSTEHYYLSCFCNISSNRPWMLVETKHLHRFTGMLFIVENKTGCLHGIGWVVSLQLLPLRSPFMHRNCSSCCLPPHSSEQRQQRIQGPSPRKGLCWFRPMQSGAPPGDHEFPRISNCCTMLVKGFVAPGCGRWLLPLNVWNCCDRDVEYPYDLLKDYLCKLSIPGGNY